jgi:hypothetical protein
LRLSRSVREDSGSPFARDAFAARGAFRPPFPCCSPSSPFRGPRVESAEGLAFGSWDGPGLHRGLRPVPHVGAGLGACVVDDGEGVGFGAGVLVGFLVGGAVDVTGRPPVVVDAGLGVVRACWAADEVWTVVGVGDAELGPTVAGEVDGVAEGLSLTRTLRLVWSPPPSVVGTMLSGRAWNPMNASSPVAMVASMTMTRLDSRGPRCAFVRITVATSPRGSVRACRTVVSARSSTDCTGSVTLCEEP